jgi:hypothetical protein
MEITPEILAQAHHIIARANSTTAGTGATQDTRPPVYKAIGLTLAIASGVFIGTSFVLKKTGLLKANVKYNEEAGEGYGYLKNAYWWTGMTLMIIGEICNFVAYAFVDAILVTPLGALSVVITTILSAIFLKERLSFVGKIGCFNCIIGSVVIVMNAPQQSSVATIQDMKHFVLHSILGRASLRQEEHAGVPEYLQSDWGLECGGNPRARRSRGRTGRWKGPIQPMVPLRFVGFCYYNARYRNHLPEREYRPRKRKWRY